jgi:GT2 family glycosyltransferase
VRLAVGIATIGRPALLGAVLEELARQTRRPDRIIVCAPAADDVAGISDGHADMIIGPRGLTRQRNAIIDRLDDFDILQFFDDDFVPATTYLAEIERAFVADPDVAMITGEVIADGIIGPGFDIAEARHRLAASTVSDGSVALEPVENGYGCNMAVRLAAVRAAQCRFDERLPLYGWLEDVDFSRQLAREGRIAKLAAARGVHLGVKQGRQSGIRLGYSQIANPIYLSRKGTCPWPRALRQMGRNVAMNLARSINPEPYVDRAGRFAGNLKAMRDLVTGRLDPQRILEL